MYMCVDINMYIFMVSPGSSSCSKVGLIFVTLHKLNITYDIFC